MALDIPSGYKAYRVVLIFRFPVSLQPMTHREAVISRYLHSSLAQSLAITLPCICFGDARHDIGRG